MVAVPAVPLFYLTNTPQIEPAPPHLNPFPLPPAFMIKFPEKFFFMGIELFLKVSVFQHIFVPQDCPVNANAL